MNDYIKIDWADVRAGDVLMHENGDRLTVRGVGDRITVVGLSLGATSWQTLGFTPHRRKPEMPTEPGAYADKRGVHWLLDIEGVWCHSGFGWKAAEDAAEYAPFTRLVPMPTEEQIREALQTANAIEVMGHVNYSTLATAVMELLAGESDE